MPVGRPPPPGRSLTGARIETSTRSRYRPRAWVAPSRERGSKHQPRSSPGFARQSLPHGSADRNKGCMKVAAPGPGRSLTGARIETPAGPAPGGRPGGRSLTGARIETFAKSRRISTTAGRSLTGARIETLTWPGSGAAAPGRSLTGARIETRRRSRSGPGRSVAPSRERGSKPVGPAEAGRRNRRSLTGARIETCRGCLQDVEDAGRSLTGARIETPNRRRSRPGSRVAPSRERGSKQRRRVDRARGPESLPHGSADRNMCEPFMLERTSRRSLTEARIETAYGIAGRRRHPRRSLTGARIETAAGRRGSRRPPVARSRER